MAELEETVDVPEFNELGKGQDCEEICGAAIMVDSEETDMKETGGPSVAEPESDELESSGAAQACEDDNTNHEQGVDLGGGWLRYWNDSESEHYYFHFRTYPTPLPP
jgi:hypothetical protein